MDDKTFEFLEKILTEVQGIKQEVQDVKQEVQGVKQEVQKIQIELENNVKPTQKLILEELMGFKEKLVEHDQRFDVLEDKIDRHDIKIQVIEGGKRA